ncbi:hypothetical protein DB88DRAFT_518058 [Papiliotrema laurentii]|uniref:Uncharacterized protein n=1 Tax=Papiliotrema laurentii TaxID=5418 RepID=A0AAD9CUV9_PAPLA|nr:hypothetical protein DB88DRAFT_518058 [Papiliotrema laurentii]
MSSRGRHRHRSNRRSKPRRKASRASVRRKRSHDRHLEATSSVGTSLHSNGFGDIDPPPPDYETSEAQNRSVAQTALGKDEAISTGAVPVNSLAMRFVWGLILGLPLLVAMGLLLLITCSSTQLRVDFNVLKFSIWPETYQGLSQIAKEQRTNDGSSLLVDSASPGGNIRERQAEAYMTLGVWGWCAKTADAQQIVCTTPSAWFSMKDTLDGRDFAYVLP